MEQDYLFKALNVSVNKNANVRYIYKHFHDVILESAHLMFGIAAETGDLFVD